MGRHEAVSYSVVIPTILRESLDDLLRSLDRSVGQTPAEIIVVVDREVLGKPRYVPQCAPLRLVRSGGRGPAAARNIGWRLARTPWVAFLDDDVVVSADWRTALRADIAAAGPTAAATQGVIKVPRPAGRRPTDSERGTIGLETSRWITADMAYRTDVLAVVGGFDEAFTRAFREDGDLGLRASRVGHIAQGARITMHPAKPGRPLDSVRAQRGNADNALMRRKHGRGWRTLTAAGAGRLGPHLLATGAGLLAAAATATGKRGLALSAATVWGAATAEFAAARIRPGPRTIAESGTMLLTSVLIPPIAVWHRAAGEALARTGLPERRRAGVVAVLFDRDDTLIIDVPYLSDPDGVRPAPGARAALRWVRRRGMLTAVVSNQSGIARGLITLPQLLEVNARVETLLGPIDIWKICPHGEYEDCDCRKPRPGLVLAAAAELGVEVGRCALIGDIGSDVEAAQTAGALPVLVPTRRTRPEEVDAARRLAAVVPDLRRAVRLAARGPR